MGCWKSGHFVGMKYFRFITFTGSLNFSMNPRFVLVSSYLRIQQIPKPDAQFTPFIPLASPHSVEVKHVPKGKSAFPVGHWIFSNCTRENNETAPEIDKIH